MRRSLTLLALALSLSASPAAQRASSPLAHLDAIAVDSRGRFVTDLTPDDLRVVEGDAVHQVEELQLVQAIAPVPGATLRPILSVSDERSEAKSNDLRLVAIFLDEYHVANGPGVERARELLTSLLDRTFTPRDLITIVKPLDSLTEIRMTRDRADLTRALSSFEGRMGNYTPKNALERNLIAADPTRAEVLRAQVSTSAINALALHLGDLRGGRKTLIVVSEGFSLAGRSRAEAGLPSLETVTRSANRSGVSIYTVDPRALVPPVSGEPAPWPSDTLRTLAHDTDGAAILAATDVPFGLDRIARDSSAYYVVGFRPNGGNNARAPQVELQSRRPDVLLRSRSVYAPPPVVIQPPVSKPATPLSVADQLQRRVSPLIRPWFGFVSSDAGVTRVQFTWQPGSRTGSAANPMMPSLATVKVLNADGTVKFQQLLGPVGSADGMPTSALFDLPAGRAVVQTVVANEEGQVLDTDVRDLTVPALDDATLSVGTPQLLLAPDDAGLRRASADPVAAPIVTREFTANDHLMIRVPVYGEPSAPKVAGLLYASNGTVMRELSFVPGPAAGIWQADVPLAELASGSYYIEFTAASGGRTKRDRVTLAIRH